MGHTMVCTRDLVVFQDVWAFSGIHSKSGRGYNLADPDHFLVIQIFQLQISGPDLAAKYQ